MCGIYYSSEWSDPSILDTIKHRGPDETNYILVNGQFFGHTRLSIIDLSADSSQPMTSISGKSLIIFNGEIYNYKSLRDDLSGKGVRFKSKGDTEVVLNGIEHFGKEFIQRLDGMFAFIFADLESGKMIFGRDLAGKNPLYYSLKHGLTAASEIRTILKTHPDIKSINEKGLQQFVRYGTIPEPDTLWTDIKMFPSGYIGEFDCNSFQLSPLHFPEPDKETAELSREKLNIYIRELVSQSVAKRLVADVEVGTFLSGGIDSTLLVGLMTKEFGLRPSTFSVIFDNPDLSEESRIEKVVSKWKPNHTYIKMDMQTVLDQIPEALNAYDHPSIDGVNTFIVSKAVRSSGLKVAVSGLGGDELFQGYGTFNQARTINSLRSVVRYIPEFAVRGNSKLNRVKDAVSFMHPSQPVSAVRSLFPESVIKDIFADAYTGWNPFLSEHDDYRLKHLKGDSALIGSEWLGYMKNMLIRDTNIMSMANSLEVRAPFTDRALFTAVLQIPDSMKRPKTVKKQLLVESCSEWLLPEIVNGHKMGFVLPMREWMLGPLNSMVRSSIGELEKIEQTRSLFDLAHKQLELLERNQTTWTRVWQWVVLGRVLNA